EETLSLAEESRSKMIEKQKDPKMVEKKVIIKPIDYAVLNQLVKDFETRFVSQIELSAEQAFWSRYSVHPEEPNLSASTTIVEVLKELPKVSLVNSSLKKLKFHLASFDMVVKERTTATAITEGTWGFEHTKACFGDDIIPFVKALKELFNSFDQFLIDELSEVQQVTKLVAKNEHLKHTYKKLYNSIKSSRVRSKGQYDDLINKVNLKSAEVSDLNASLQEKVLVITALKETISNLKDKKVVTEAVSLNPIDLDLLKIDVAPLALKLRKNGTAHTDYIRHTQEEAAILREIVESERLVNPLNTSLDYACCLILLWYLDSGCSKHMTGDRSQLVNFVQKFLGTVKFGNDHVAKIMAYGDYQIRNVTISWVYYVEGLGHNLFSVAQFCDSDLEVAFRQHTCFIRNLDRVDLLTGSRGNNLYTLSLQDMMASSPICLLSKASKTKSWLWHRRLSHLNFGAINHLARQGLVRGLPKLKFEKITFVQHVQWARVPRKLTNPNLKRPTKRNYICYTWTFDGQCVSKDETPDFIIKFLKMIQVRLKVSICHIQTDNGIEFVNQTLRDYYEEVGISHETSVACSPQQNGVVERCNRTLIEAARTMLIYA
nr:retrovirus-related Pol polyprotein from transposon TNT 1-94 [Tanacetum cinerariifolium]